MKSLIILLLLISTFSFSQNDEQIKYLQTHKPKWFSNTAGEEFVKYSNHFYFGFILSGAGAYLTYSGTQIQNKMISNVGWGTVLIGSLLMLESHRHIYRAGLILDSRGVGITIPINKK